MQKRKGFIFPDTKSNINEGRGGYRPNIPDSYFQDGRYHENNDDFNNFRNKNDHHGFHDQLYDKHRQKYRPGLLGVSVGRLGAVVVTGPNGYKHVIHNLPPWTDLNTTPETEHYQGSFPGNMDARGGLEHPASHRFSAGFHESPQAYDHKKNHQQTHKMVPIYFGSSDKKNDSQFLAVYKNSVKSYNGKPPVDTSNILHQTDKRVEQDYTAPPQPHKFQPSPPFYKYSEPDPLYHPNGSPLHTYSPTDVTQSPNTLPSNTSTTSKPNESTQSPVSEKPLKYPDSINVQLPPPAHDSDTRVPYVAATEVTEQTPNQHLTVATQVSDASHKESLIKILLTKPSVYSSTESEIQSSTPQTQTSIVKENKTLSPTSLTRGISTHPGPAEVSVYTAQMAHTDNSIKTEHTLPTIITEKSDIIPHQSAKAQVSYMTEQSHDITNRNTAQPTSSQELFTVKYKSDITETSVTNDAKDTENKNYTAAVYITAVTPLQSSSSPNRSKVVSDSGIKDAVMLPETNMVTIAAAAETSYNSTQINTEENSYTVQTVISYNEDIQPTVETDKTEQVTKTEITDTLPNVSNLHAENTVTKRVPFMVNQLQTLVRHAQSLNYLHHDSSTTVIPTNETDW
jgi:hypothetical protein